MNMPPESASRREPHSLAGHQIRDLPASTGWNVSKAGPMFTAIPVRNFEKLTKLPVEARADDQRGDVLIHIADASRPDLDFGRPYERRREHEGLQLYVSTNPDVRGDRLLLPQPYQGRIDCVAGALERGTPSCMLVVTSNGIRHTLTIAPDQIAHWRDFVDGYLRFMDELGA
ncbi:hypothetical protein [Phenylobacterium sp.]|uniref:hypothetical protein n=1 Tax=Phenylobacterium sp. TaxID=1871053 RepID=UPI0025EB9614|nr:hypothetical protein [Phenylobacterium sp.]